MNRKKPRSKKKMQGISHKARVLILGSRGMLGQELTRLYSKDNDYSVTAWDKDELDMTKKSEMEDKISALRPAVIINAAAYNAVDACEDKANYAIAKKINSAAPARLARIAKKIKAKLVHYSSDYVFDGNPDISLEPPGCSGSCAGCNLHHSFVPLVGYGENSKTHPINKYGLTKLLGERAVIKNSGKYYVIRLS